jgi:hypothetical protein
LHSVSIGCSLFFIKFNEQSLKIGCIVQIGWLKVVTSDGVSGNEIGDEQQESSQILMFGNSLSFLFSQVRRLPVEEMPVSWHELLPCNMHQEGGLAFKRSGIPKITSIPF